MLANQTLLNSSPSFRSLNLSTSRQPTENRLAPAQSILSSGISSCPSLIPSLHLVLFCLVHCLHEKSTLWPHSWEACRLHSQSLLPRASSFSSPLAIILLNKGSPYYLWASLVAQTVKNLSAVQETRVRSLVQKDPQEKEMAIPGSILA